MIELAASRSVQRRQKMRCENARLLLPVLPEVNRAQSIHVQGSSIFLKLTVHPSTDSGRAGEIYSLVETFPFMLSLSKHARRFFIRVIG